MTTVYCDYEDCIHYAGGECHRGSITVGEDYYAGCADFESHRASKEYSYKYFMALKDKDGKVCKGEVYKAKRIEYNGFVFYTTDRTDDSEQFFVTEERTGYWCGDFRSLKELHWDKFVEEVSKLPNVEDYPLAKKDNLGRWAIKEGNHG